MSGAPLLLVRHAKAGDRSRWAGDDRLRPLSKAGRRQAIGLIDRLDGLPIARIISSPYVRCVQTVEPLASARALPVEEADPLSEGARLEDVLALIEALGGDPAALCSHGDVFPMVVRHYREQGMRIEGAEGWKKGSTWVLEREGEAFVRARSLPPPG